MKIDLRCDIEIPEQAVRASMIFAHSTRIADFATPDIERVVQPATALPAHVVEIRVRTGESGTHADCREIPTGQVARLKHEIKKTIHRRVATIDIGDRFALDMRFSFMGNFAHLVHDVLGPLRFIEQTLAQREGIDCAPIHVILPKNAPEIALRVLEFAGVPIICTDGAVRGNLISISQELNLTLLPYLDQQPFSQIPEPTPEKVFVSRRGARALRNEDEVTRFLASEGFSRVYMEDLALGEQWSTLARAKEVVGIHGAGLSSLGFSVHRPFDGARRFGLIELFGPGFVSTCFRSYAAVLNGTWVGVRGKITPEVIRDLDILGHPRAHENACFEIDIKSLAEAVRYSRSEAEV